MFKQRCFRLLLLASAIATSLSAAAYDFESAGIYYNITGNNTVEVTYSDRNNNTYSGSVSIPETVTSNGTEYSVTTIGESAFQGSAVTSVSMPECITSIDYNAFKGCQNLESVTLPESLTTLGSYAFYSCKLLKAVKIPSGVTAIPSSCFYECSSLESVTIPEGVTTIGDDAFSGCNLNALTLPESLEKIGNYAFCSNSSLKSVNIPAKVKTIGMQAFCNCCLTDLVIPEGVQTIGDDAFERNSLKKLTLPSTIKSIGNEAFNCYSDNLQSITCNAVTPPMLGNNAFGSGITPSIKVPMASIAAYRKAYGWKDFSNYYGGEMVADGITYRIDEKGTMVAVAEATLTKANILSSVEFEGNQYAVTKINEKVFSGNTNLESVVLPESLTTLGDYAFNLCRNLESVKIPNTVTSIKHRAFQYCCNLESIIIPSSVNSIGISAFSECKALKDIYCQAVNVPETHSSAFDNSPIEKMTLYVPGESMNAYKTTDPWSGFGKFQTLTTGIEKTETAAKPMITTADGQISVSGLSGNATIQVLSLDGKLLDSTSATDGIATLNAQPGEVVIVKVGTESYKVVVR